MAAIDVNLVERVEFSDSDDDGFEYKAVDAEDVLDDDDDLETALIELERLMNLA